MLHDPLHDPLDMNAGLSTTHTTTIRQVINTDVGFRPTSLIHPRRVVDGSTLEKISDTESRKPRYTSELPSGRQQNDVTSPTQRLSIDGSDIESISDSLKLRNSRQKRSLAPNLASISAAVSPQTSQTTPRRSKYANYGRKGPSSLGTPKSRSVMLDSRWRSDSLSPSLSPSSPSIITLRPTPFQLPKLVIPDNGRPPVQSMQAEWFNPGMTKRKPVAKPKTEVLEYVAPVTPIAVHAKYLTYHCSDDADSPISISDSLVSITRDIIRYVETTNKELSPLEAPKLSHNIRLPSALDFPDLSYTPQTDTSPIRSIFLEHFDTLSNQQTTTPLPPNSTENGTMSLFSAIYKILRNPSSAGSNNSGRFSLISASPQSPSDYVSPLFSTRSPPRPLTISVFPSFSRNEKKKFCNVCQEDVLISKFPTRPTRRCRHESSTCQDCIVQWIQSCVDDGKMCGIKCPTDSCREDLSDEDVEVFAHPDVFKRYLSWKAGYNRNCH
jgi:hypothetical protein